MVRVGPPSISATEAPYAILNVDVPVAPKTTKSIYFPKHMIFEQPCVELNTVRQWLFSAFDHGKVHGKYPKGLRLEHNGVEWHQVDNTDGSCDMPEVALPTLPWSKHIEGVLTEVCSDMGVSGTPNISNQVWSSYNCKLLQPGAEVYRIITKARHMYALGTMSRDKLADEMRRFCPSELENSVTKLVNQVINEVTPVVHVPYSPPQPDVQRDADDVDGSGSDSEGDEVDAYVLDGNVDDEERGEPYVVPSPVLERGVVPPAGVAPDIVTRAVAADAATHAWGQSWFDTHDKKLCDDLEKTSTTFITKHKVRALLKGASGGWDRANGPFLVASPNLVYFPGCGALAGNLGSTNVHVQWMNTVYGTRIPWATQKEGDIMVNIASFAVQFLLVFGPGMLVVPKVTQSFVYELLAAMAWVLANMRTGDKPTVTCISGDAIKRMPRGGVVLSLRPLPDLVVGRIVSPSRLS